MKLYFSALIVTAALTLLGCNGQPHQQAIDTHQLPDVFPNDFGATIPYNIAPINIRYNGECDQLYIHYKGVKTEFGKLFDGFKTDMPIEEWASFLDENKGDSIQTTLWHHEQGKWYKHRPFSYYISPDAIDGYLVYRNIHPGYQTWNYMGIFQRSLTSFEIKTVLDSKLMQHTCMNCHTMANNNPDHMVLHLRENNAATIMVSNGNIEKINTQTEHFKSVSFPSWHPSTNYIAFSINKVRQMFPATGQERAHGFDVESDMVIYNVAKKEYIYSPLLMSKSAYEAFPCFAPNGKTLYFISAPAMLMPDSSKYVKYSLCAIPFDAETGQLGTTVDTLISAKTLGKSVTMPKVSPDGRHVVVTVTDHGNFPAYFKDAELYSYNLLDKALTKLDDLNSDDVESYHSWSSTGRWMVFSSRRMDGLYMNCYLAHFDENGTPSKPFLLPQQDADFHKSFLFSFNLPEFAVKPIEVSAYDIEKAAKRSTMNKSLQDHSH